ncbi:PhoH family protein [bacterium]|nr:PhoH family protein [bacterium]
MSESSVAPATTEHQFVLEPADNARLAALCGPADAHLRSIEQRLGVELRNRGAQFQVIGTADAVAQAERVIRELFADTRRGETTPDAVHLGVATAPAEHAATGADREQGVAVQARRITVRGRTPNQRKYLSAVREHDLNFGIGPAGTGKTYLAVACAVEALETERVRRLVLVRPAVEAGERLGFLPGDLAQKIDPYLRPLYDALYEMLGTERVTRLMERNVIELAPLAYMRGRTLNEAFIILDEAQNTTVEQMKMFLTRIGFGSTAVVTGDVSQVDLPRGQRSGLRHVMDVLGNVEGISFTRFAAEDVVRHPLVQRIVRAYEQAEQREAGQ